MLNFSEHKGEVFGVAWNHSLTNLVASSGMDSTVRLYDIQKGVPYATLIDHKGVVYGVTWHPTINTIFATSSADRTVKLWDNRQGSKVIKTIDGHMSEVMSCDFNKYENYIATSESNGKINIFDLRQDKSIPMIMLEGHRLPTRKAVFSPHFSSILASISYDMNVFIWDIKKNMPVYAHKQHREFGYGIDFSLFDNKRMASIGWDRSLYVFNFDEPITI